ncbi:hypothetical protein JOD45_000701 [Scopulibacillus daqui]|uniref:Uncharacterized protein n=2 Tax=Scopulibacillus daqui TaxID=1469162 RepID=A0ABS2PWU1_9BACL|nr:hypothetical protein [Scopulibacillus daqui]
MYGGDTRHLQPLTIEDAQNYINRILSDVMMGILDREYTGLKDRYITMILCD